LFGCGVIAAPELLVTAGRPLVHAEPTSATIKTSLALSPKAFEASPFTNAKSDIYLFQRTF
jgi:hypothetical protein